MKIDSGDFSMKFYDDDSFEGVMPCGRRVVFTRGVPDEEHDRLWIERFTQNGVGVNYVLKKDGLGLLSVMRAIGSFFRNERKATTLDRIKGDLEDIVDVRTKLQAVSVLLSGIEQGSLNFLSEMNAGVVVGDVVECSGDGRRYEVVEVKRYGMGIVGRQIRLDGKLGKKKKTMRGGWKQVIGTEPGDEAMSAENGLSLVEG